MDGDDAIPPTGQRSPVGKTSIPKQSVSKAMSEPEPDELTGNLIPRDRASVARG